MAEFTVKRARQHSRRRLKTIKASLHEVAAHWGDLDNGVIGNCDDAIAMIDAIEEGMNEAVTIEEERDND